MVLSLCVWAGFSDSLLVNGAGRRDGLSLLRLGYKDWLLSWMISPLLGAKPAARSCTALEVRPCDEELIEASGQQPAGKGGPQSNNLQGTESCQHRARELGSGSFPSRAFRRNCSPAPIHALQPHEACSRRPQLSCTETPDPQNQGLNNKGLLFEVVKF